MEASIIELAKQVADVGLLYIIASIAIYLVIIEVKTRPKREEERNKYLAEHTKSNNNLTLSHQALIKTLELLQASYLEQGHNFVRHDERSIETVSIIKNEVESLKDLIQNGNTDIKIALAKIGRECVDDRSTNKTNKR